MWNWIQQSLEWVHQHEALVWWLGVSSVVTFVGSLLMLPILISRIPVDYFVDDDKPIKQVFPVSPTTQLVIRIAKNVLGLLFVLAGIAMLLLPGQGLLSILVGLTLLDFPGKRTLQHNIIERPTVYKTVNWIRAKRGQPPIRRPSENNGTSENCVSESSDQT